MTANISSVPGRTLVLRNPLFPALAGAAERIRAMISTGLNARTRTQEAIEILRDASSSPDRCDWAERYLCGMADADESRHSEGRQTSVVLQHVPLLGRRML